MHAASPTVLAALSHPKQCTLRTLLGEYDLEGVRILDACNALEITLDYFKLSVDPPIGVLGLDDYRVLKLRPAGEADLNRILRLIDGGERPTVEFKSSISINTKRLDSIPGVSPNDCIDEKLVQKAAKEIAAFLNTDGGTILFGVTDDHAVRGCAEDMSTFAPGGSNADKADLIIKRLVDKYFRENVAVFSHLKIECVDIDGFCVVSVSIASRRRLSFLKNVEGPTLFLRSGTHSIPIEYHDIEQFFSLQRL